jgi:GNAT superfamily N-acetyltransferase
MIALPAPSPTPVQRLQPRHAGAYRALMLEAYAAHPDSFTSSAPERAALPLSWWEARLCPQPTPRELVFGAFHEEVLVGAVGLSFETREKIRHKATLFGMVVADRFQRQGLGRALVQEALDCAGQRAGVLRVLLSVTDGNPAQGLYQRCGFVSFGLEPCAVAVGQRFVSKIHMGCSVGQGQRGHFLDRRGSIPPILLA